MSRPTLLVQTVYFDEAEAGDARRLGMDLYDLLTRPLHDPLGLGPGIPVLAGVAPEYVDPQAAEVVVVIPVLGIQSFQMQRQVVLAQLTSWHKTLGPKHVLPVPTASVWRNAESRLPVKQLLTELYGLGERRKVTLDEIVLGISRLFESGTDRPTLFISHAKADLASTEQAAENIQRYVVSDTTGKAFFDKTELYAGEPLEEQLDEAVRQGVFVAMRGDTYGSRVWCQRELLTAKLEKLPTLTVEVLRRGEQRSSPYGGNCPTLLWNGDPAAVASRAMVEWLRAVHFQREAERIKQLAGLPSDTIALVRPPELLDLAQGPLTSGDPQLVIHPDPELSVPERMVLKAANSRLHLVTPTTAFRRLLTQEKGIAAEVPLDGLQVAMSLSDSPDTQGPEGFMREHVDDATVYLARSLISAGAAIAYGGDFRKHGFTPLLGELIQAYNQTAAHQADYLHSYLAATIDLGASLDLPLTIHHLLHSPEMRQAAILPPPSPDEPHPSALYFSDMRQVMAKFTDARIVLGGGAEPRVEEGGPGYGGRFPGIVEEAWRTLQAEKPLYVIGGFGGAAALVAELLEGNPTPKRLQDATWKQSPRFRTTAKAIDADPLADALGLPTSLDDLADEIRAAGRRMLASDEAALRWNGLTVAENLELLRTRDLVTLTSLVMKGLLAVTRRRHAGQLEIELVHGSVTGATGLDAIAVALFDDIPLGGAAAALDQATGSLAAWGREEGQSLISVRDTKLDADWLYLASLGRLDDASQLIHRIEQAARGAAQAAHRHGLRRLGVVAFGGTVVGDLAAAVEAMITGLQDPAYASVSWFETDEQRYQQIADLLKDHDDVKLTQRKATLSTAVPLREREELLILHVSYVDGDLAVSVLPPAGSGIAAFSRVGFSDAEIEAISAGAGRRQRRTPGMQTLESRGLQLSRLLLGDAAEELLAHAAEAKTVIVHDVAASRLPFEMLASAISGPVAVRHGMNRRLAVSGVPVEHILGRPPRAGRFRVLLIVDPTQDLAGAAAEGKAVLDVLQQFPQQIEVTVLKGRDATKAVVAKALPQADMLHYCGHAFFDGPGETDSGLMLHGHDPLTLRDLQRIEMPRIAFVNACEAGRVRGTVVTGAASFAEFFLRSGVEAYLGTFWLVGDRAATEFSRTVYGNLAAGRSLDEAVTAGRKLLFTADQPEPDWANYILYGDGRFRLIQR